MNLNHTRWHYFPLVRPVFLALLTVIVLSGVLGTGIFAQDSGVCMVTARQNANIREKAQVASNRIGDLVAGESAVAIAQTLDSDGYIWWKLDQEGWVRSDIVEENENCSKLPDDST